MNELTIDRFMQVAMLVKVLYGSLAAGHERVLHSLNTVECTHIHPGCGSVHDVRHLTETVFHLRIMEAAHQCCHHLTKDG